jgi:hypothetical protein
MCEKAFAIRGETPPPAEVSAPPVLLPIRSPAEISWRGSAGASAYDIERASTPDGPWILVGLDVDDAAVQYRPLFADNYTEAGGEYYYRIRAKNSAGSSDPSNVIGPVRVHGATIVDDLADFSKIFAHSDGVSLDTGDPRPYKEDAHRLKGRSDAWVIYRTLQPFQSAAISAFLGSNEPDFEFYVSVDGKRFERADSGVTRFPAAVNPYGYKLPVRYDLAVARSDYRFLKIVFRSAAQIGRIEVSESK